ncbi:RmlC-like cupin domain-containing protein [Aspergillus undulatus]|uniref:RmlC-like cupin domain-containing protein n=1 Tax=Aspergillus undulatus TaxID=1810928 RepID=UPI003CCD2F58
MLDHVVQLKCGVKHDPWGKLGKDSLAGNLWAQTPGSSGVSDNERYSEMWMGTYPTVPARLLRTGETLETYLSRKPELVGQDVQKRFANGLPFLPKILSFDKALPLQVHPDKRLAEKLHLQDPENFGDANHKPEIAVALSEFELFAGFKPLKDIEALMSLKPLGQFVPANKSATFDDELLRQICLKFLQLPPDVVAETVKRLLSLPQEQFKEKNQGYVPGLLDRIAKQYSESDNGVLVAVLLMNYMVLKPGEAVCVPADSIHAYLKGDILECMARSDNVLATGFCPRPDRNNAELFSRALSFKPHNINEAVLSSKKSERGELGKSVDYAPPFSEFNVLATRLGTGEEERLKAIEGPSVLVVTRGSGELVVKEEKKLDLHQGAVFFVGAGVPVEVLSKEGIELFRPYAE